MEIISPHPFYPDNPMQQAKLEAAIEFGFIEREILTDGNAKYTLTQGGEIKWELELVVDNFMR